MPLMANTITHWIDGKLSEKTAERHGEVYNPATGDVQSHVALATPAVVDEAVESAWKASQSWRSVSIAKRTKIMFAFRQLVDKHQHELAKLLTLEHGKVTADALGEVNRGLEVIEFACGIADLGKGEYSENVSTEVDSYSIRQPLGVVAGITPFNFPAMVPMWMYPIAIACGNTFVLKPSERDPSCANFTAELLAEAGLPPGVFNVVHGDKVAVDGLLNHPKVAGISSETAFDLVECRCHVARPSVRQFPGKAIAVESRLENLAGRSLDDDLGRRHRADGQYRPATGRAIEPQ